MVAAALVALTVLAATLLLASTRRDAAIDEQHDQVARTLAIAGNSIEQTVSSHASVAAVVAAWVANANRSPTALEFERFARALLAAQPSLRAVELAPDGIISYIEPLVGNEQAAGLDLNVHRTGRVSMSSLRAGAALIIEGPVDLVQGGQGLILRHRIDIDDDGNPATPRVFWGPSITLVDFTAVVRAAGLDHPDLSWSLERISEGAALLAGEPQQGRDPLVVEVSVPGAMWELAGSPSDRWGVAAGAQTPLLVGGALMAAVLAALAWVFASQPIRLRAKVAEATAELARSNARTDSVMNAASDGIVALGPTGALLACNPAARHLLRIGEEDLDGPTLLDLVPLDQIRVTTREQDGYLTGQSTVRVQRLDGSDFPADVAIATAPGGAVRTVIIRDVTERERTTEDLRQHTHQLERLNTELRDLDRVKRDFMAVASHEIRTPITAIRGFAITLSTRWEDLSDEDRRRSLDVIHRQATRLWHLVNDVLTTSQIEGGSLSPRAVPVQVAAVLSRAVTDSQIQPGDVVSHVPPDLAATIDREHLTRILVAFLTNAAKYGRAPVEVKAELTVDGLVVSVHDRGEGVTEDFKERLFEPFSQASTGERRTAAGTGLGLSVARGLARASGGDVWYARNPQGGSVFNVRLPARGMTVAQRAPTPPRLRALIREAEIEEAVAQGAEASVGAPEPGVRSSATSD